MIVMNEWYRNIAQLINYKATGCQGNLNSVTKVGNFWPTMTSLPQAAWSRGDSWKCQQLVYSQVSDEDHAQYATHKRRRRFIETISNWTNSWCHHTQFAVQTNTIRWYPVCGEVEGNEMAAVVTMLTAWRHCHWRVLHLIGSTDIRPELFASRLDYSRVRLIDDNHNDSRISLDQVVMMLSYRRRWKATVESCMLTVNGKSVWNKCNGLECLTNDRW